MMYALMGLLAINFACEDDTVTPPSTTPEEVLEGNITTRTLDATRRYLIRGQAFVQTGQVLTIPAGTVLRGEKRTKGTLIINEGGQLVANGTAQNPIVFTSNLGVGERDRGDWGGIVMLGRANTNQNRPAIEGISPAAAYGTQNSTANDGQSSGSLQFVRIEFAGIELTPNNETNSLTMGGIGRGTTIQNVQVSFGGDDGFEWFGGVVNCRNLISFSTWDDDFDLDFGYSGNVQFGLALRNPSYADQSGSNGFEVDNDAAGNDFQPLTAAVFSNITVLGPRTATNSSINGNYQNAMHIRRRAAISIFNSVFSGFPVGLRLDGASTVANYTGSAPLGVLANNTLIAIGTNSATATSSPVPYAASGTADATPTRDYFQTAALSNTLVSVTAAAGAAAAEPEFTANNLNKAWFFNQYPIGQYPANPAFTVASPVAASYTNPKLAPEFFTKTANYRGAFGATDWTDGWANFDPIDATY